MYKKSKTFLISDRILTRIKFTTEKYKNIDKIFALYPSLNLDHLFSCHKIQFKKIRGISIIFAFFMSFSCVRHQALGVDIGSFDINSIFCYLQLVHHARVSISFPREQYVTHTCRMSHDSATNQTTVILRYAHGAQPIRTRPQWLRWRNLKTQKSLTTETLQPTLEGQG